MTHFVAQAGSELRLIDLPKLLSACLEAASLILGFPVNFKSSLAI